MFCCVAVSSDGEATDRLCAKYIDNVKAYTTHEKVIDIAGDADNGARVDLDTCAVTGTGSAQLCATWRDPDFDPARRAVYYARVVENPSCRWSQYVCNRNGIVCSDPETIRPGFEDCCSALHQPAIQERAWTSPVWYTPDPSLVRKLDFYPGLQEKLPPSGFHIGTLRKSK